MMLERLLEPTVKDALGKCLAGVMRKRQNDVPVNLQPKEWDLASHLVPFLCDFKDVTDVVGGQNYTTISLVAPMIDALQVKCDRTIADAKLPAAVRECARLSLTTLTNKFNKEQPMCVLLGMALDPALKMMDSLPDQTRQAVWTELARRCHAVVLPGQGDVKEPAEKKLKSSRPGLDLVNRILEVKAPVAPAAAAGSATSASGQEFAAFMTEPIDVETPPLAWWFQHRGTFPRLSLIALSVFCVPATSCPAERLFSVAGNVLTAKRACLSDDMLDALTCLHGNQDLTKKSSIPVVAADFDE
jgi:hypothetical protein